MKYHYVSYKKKKKVTKKKYHYVGLCKLILFGALRYDLVDQKSEGNDDKSHEMNEKSIKL